MKTIKTYSTSVEAEVARIALDAAGVASVVVGVGAGMEGGTGGVKLLVEDDDLERALGVAMLRGKLSALLLSRGAQKTSDLPIPGGSPHRFSCPLHPRDSN